MRRLWIAAAGLALILVVPLLALRSDSVVLRLVHWSLETFADLRLELVNPHIDLFRGIVAADEVHLIPTGVEAPPLISVIELAAETHLREIYRGNLIDTSVQAEQLLIYVSELDESSDPTPLQWLDLLFWVPSGFAVGQTHVILTSDDTRVAFLRNLEGERNSKGRFHATAESFLRDRHIDISLDSFVHSEDRQISRLELDAELIAPDIDSSISLNGDVIATDEQASYDFLVAGKYRDIRDFLSAIDAQDMLEGTLVLNARMQGDIRGFTLSDMSVVVDNMPSYGFEAGGDLRWDGEETVINLAASGELDSMEYLVDWLNLDLKELGRAEAGLRLSGSLAKPFIEKFIVATSSDEGLNIIVTGQLDLRTADAPSRRHNEIYVDAFAPSINVLERWLGQIPVDPGPWRASAAASGVVGDVSISQLLLETGSHDTYKLRIEGAIDQVADVRELGPAAITGIDLDATAHTFDSATLSRLAGRALPDFQEVFAKIHIDGSGDKLVLSNGVVDISSSDLRAEAGAIQGKLFPGQTAWLQDLTATLSASVSDTSALSQYTNREIPVLGPVQLQGQLSQRDTVFRLDNLRAAINNDDFQLETTGKIADLARWSGISLESHFTGVDIRHALLALLQEFQYEQPLGKLQGHFSVRNLDGKWHIPELSIKTQERDGPVSFTSQGSIADLTGFTTADIDSRFNIRDPALGEALTGLRIKPTRGALAIESTPDVIAFNSRTHSGDTLIKSDVEIEHDEKVIHKLRMAINSPHLHLDDLGLQSQVEGDDDYKPADRLEKLAQLEQLGRLLEKTPDFPMQLSIKLGHLTGRRTYMSGLDVQLTSAEERYTLRRFYAEHGKSQLELLGSIDLNPEPPESSLAGEVVALPLGTLGKDLGLNSGIQGTLTARGGVSLKGRIGDKLAGTLNGYLALALEDTVIQGAAYDVLATDLLAWIYSGALLQTSTDVDCAMASFRFEDGVATSDDLYIETPRMIATGDARFDLVKRKMDLTVVPRSRSRTLQIPSRIRLRGDMSDPRPTISPVSAAADASAQALLLVPKLAMRLFGQGGDASDKGIQPCLAQLDNPAL